MVDWTAYSSNRASSIGPGFYTLLQQAIDDRFCGNTLCAWHSLTPPGSSSFLSFCFFFFSFLCCCCAALFLRLVHHTENCNDLGEDAQECLDEIIALVLAQVKEDDAFPIVALRGMYKNAMQSIEICVYMKRFESHDWCHNIAVEAGDRSSFGHFICQVHPIGGRRGEGQVLRPGCHPSLSTMTFFWNPLGSVAGPTLGIRFSEPCLARSPPSPQKVPLLCCFAGVDWATTGWFSDCVFLPYPDPRRRRRSCSRFPSVQLQPLLLLLPRPRTTLTFTHIHAPPSVGA